MPRFSLVTATIGRTKELEFLLDSLANQEMQDFELVVVDQNTDDRLVPILSKWVAQVQSASHSNVTRLHHVRSQPGLSKARNVGLRYCSGEIIAFPDDDCWYFPQTLKNIDTWFKENSDYGILSVGSRDEQGRKSGNRWNAETCDLTPINIFRASVSYTFFVRRPSGEPALRFDESLGVGSGTQFGAGEDTDFLLGLMGHGIRGRFYAKWHVGHPMKGYIDVKRAANYGRGWGRVIAKHSLPLLGIGFVTFDFVRAMLGMLKGNREAASMWWAHGCGIVSAYFSKESFG